MRSDRARVLLFAGTTEGRLLAEYLANIKCPAIVCVATEYGRERLLHHIDSGDRLEVCCGRLDAEDMKKLLLEKRPGLVIDATHPYAVQVTENIQKACKGNGGVRYIRCLRDRWEEKAAWNDLKPDMDRRLAARYDTEGSRNPQSDITAAGDIPCGTAMSETAHSDIALPEIVHAPDIEGAVSWLALREGNILAATGSKELAAYCRIKHYEERVYARVLPSREALSACAALGVGGRHIIAMQGPFSREMNLALLKEFGCRYLVTKDGGRAGGMKEKLEAAALADAVVVVLDRPDSGKGISLGETKRLLEEWMEHEEKGIRR